MHLAIPYATILRNSVSPSKGSRSVLLHPAATTLHAPQASQGFNLRVWQSLLAGIGLSELEVDQLAANTAKTGKLPTRKASHEDLEKLCNGDWIGLLNVTVATLCYDSNKALSS